jgi:hypothetical protein
MSKQGEKLRTSHSSKSLLSSTTKAASPVAPQQGRKSSQGRSSQGSSHNRLGTLLILLAFAACLLQFIMFQPDRLMQHSHWQQLDSSGKLARFNDNATTMNRNIMGVLLQEDSSSGKNNRNEEEKVILQELKDINLTKDAYPKADIANDEHPIIQLLKNAGITDLTLEDKKHLPDWKALQRLYGNLEEPIIVGLETCATYRNTVPPPKRYAAVAGLFNTGK